MKKISVAIITSVLLVLSAGASADTVSQVWSCKLNEGKTQEDAQAINAKWLKRAREITGSDAVTSTFVNTAVGDTGGFMWVDSFPDFATWAKLMDADENEELNAAFNELQTCTGNRLYQGEETEAAK
jgi:hypothetical protein